MLGLEEDRQKHKKVHGGPDRAVCVYSLEVILALQAEGHPIYPGSAGENVTVSGLDWTAVIPGSRFELGTTVVLEVTRYTEPCKLIAESFTAKAFRRIDQVRNPGWSRVYTRVIREGVVRIGEPVRLAQ
ncbi:MAG: MOSC domain-containing protein [Deltaproteobacteria bacterium]|nr:MOSC domain-containing protein [Deltaproteobacteria bacterium]